MPNRSLADLTDEERAERQRLQRRDWYVRNGGWQGEKARRDPVKRKAREAVREAVRRGRISRGLCAHCGSAETESHHEDYSKPMEVIWLCRLCHLAEHARRGDTRSVLSGGTKPLTPEKIQRLADEEAKRAIRLAKHRINCWWKYPPDDLFG